MVAGILVAAAIVGVTVPLLRARAEVGAVPEASLAACDVSQQLDAWPAGSRVTMSARDDHGAVLVDHGAETPSETASNMKLLTMTAAVETLGAGTRLETRVFADAADPGTVVLVGGGDPTLSRLPSGQSSVYPEAPHLDDLAARVVAARAADPAVAGVPITRVVADTSLFGGPAWVDSWPAGNRANGSMPFIEPLMVDGDRDDPTEEYSRRGDHPAYRAAAALADRLAQDGVGPADGGITAVTGLTPARGALLATVRSAPVGTLVGYALTHSDNTLAEMLARLTAIRRSAGSTFSAIQSGTSGALASLGVSVDGLVLVDGSGLSPRDRVTPAFMTRLMLQIAERQELAPVYAGLPIAGRTGTLAEDGRFQSANAAAAGHLRAKTGTLPDMMALTGITDSEFGSRVAFTIWVRGEVDRGTRNRIDALAAITWRCGGLLRAS